MSKKQTIQDLNLEYEDSSSDYDPKQSDNDSSDDSSDSSDSSDSEDSSEDDEKLDSKVVEKPASKSVEKKDSKAKVVEKPASKSVEKKDSKAKVVEKPASKSIEKKDSKTKVVEKPASKLVEKKDGKVTKPITVISNNNPSDDELPDYDVPEHIFSKPNIEDELNDFEVPSEILIEKKPKKVITPEEKIQALGVVPFVLRKSFPFCFWYISHSDDKELKKIKQITLDVIQKILDVDDCTIYLIKGNKEKDRIRVICPDIFVDSQISKDLRSLILRDLGYKVISNIIPVLIYEVPVTPTILLPRIWDMGLDKWESYQTYSCIIHPKLKTEEIEKLMLKWSLYDISQELTEFSNDYIEYLKIKDSNTTNSNVLEEEELVAVSIGDNVISDEIKKEFGNNLDKCIEWFKKYHPDSGLRMIKKIGEDREVFFLDFTKSKHKCRLCDLVHLSNRQYLTYSNKSKKAFYHCYDSDAKDKKHIISFNKPKRGSEVISAV